MAEASAQETAVEEGKLQGKEIASSLQVRMAGKPLVIFKSLTWVVQSTAGHMDLLESAMMAANEMLPSRTRTDNANSKRAGKMFISHGPNTLCLMCHVPE
eukprot:1032645-Rhodomonas_salina.1